MSQDLSALLPPVYVGGHELNIFCEMHDQALMGTLAACCTWRELKLHPPTQLANCTEDEAYSWAAARTAQYRKALGLRSFRAKSLARLQEDLFDPYGFAELRWALLKLK